MNDTIKGKVIFSSNVIESFRGGKFCHFNVLLSMAKTVYILQFVGNNRFIIPITKLIFLKLDSPHPYKEEEGAIYRMDSRLQQ